MGGWEALIAGVIGAASAYQSSRAAKKQSESVHDNWERRMAYEEEKVRRKQNSMGAKAAPYLMEQMLRVYGQQSAGRGGFTLPIDEMLQSMNIKGREDGSYNSSSGGSYDGGYGNDTPQGRAGAFSAKKTNDGRKSGSFRVIAGSVDPEIDGYNGKTWNSGGKSSSLEGAASGGDGYWGISSGAVGGPREATRGMGNTTTQTERGYDQRTPVADGKGFSVSQRTPIQHGDLATGGEYSAATFGREVNLPPDVMKKLGVGALKQGASKFVPGFGILTMVGGKLYQRYGKSDGKQSWLETLLGIKDKNHGRWFGNNPDQVDPQIAYSPYNEPVSPLG